jgi:hypothetical protein
VVIDPIMEVEEDDECPGFIDLTFLQSKPGLYRPESLETDWTSSTTPELLTDRSHTTSHARMTDVIWESISTRDKPFKAKYF